MIEDYWYQLPKNLIANSPKKPRNKSRLLVFDSKNRTIQDLIFSQLENILKKGDLLVFNSTKVFPARLFGRKKTGGAIEFLLLEECFNSWKVLIRGKIKIGDAICFDQGLEAIVEERCGKEAYVVFNKKGRVFWKIIDQIGKTPIPPYIKNNKISESDLRSEYQTVYADKFGSAAAPTAGMHFSKSQIEMLEKRGVEIAYLDLNIGLGTFAPLTDKNIYSKKLHSEKFQIPFSTARKINQIKINGGRIIAVGTTTVRALESAAEKIIKHNNNCADIVESTDIFIQPGFKFKIVDSLITNFHLPSSSLMMMVAAFIQCKGIKDGRGELLKIYQQAINKNYRFYSFGDAMIIL